MTDRDPDDLERLRADLVRERMARAAAERIAEEASLAHAELLEGLEAAKEEVLAAKREVLNLSNLILPIWESVLLMPVIGHVDTDRAALLLDKILAEAARRNAAVVILDVSGVPAFERETGQLFQRFHDALALVGARMVLSGVRPAVAHHAARDVEDAMQTFGRIPTSRNLRMALRWAIDEVED